MAIKAIQNDGYGKMEHYVRFQAGYLTEYRSDGYYWSHRYGKWNGPFRTRKLAEAAELNASKGGKR